MFGKKEMEKLEQLIKEHLVSVVRDSLADATTVLGKVKKIHDLEKDVQRLELEKKSREWEFDKREMEVEHKVGLERKRQEFEVDEARRTAMLEVKEENLKAQQERFEKQMDFITERFEQEVGYLKDILGQVLECIQGVKPSGGGLGKNGEDK